MVHLPARGESRLHIGELNQFNSILKATLAMGGLLPAFMLSNTICEPEIWLNSGVYWVLNWPPELDSRTVLEIVRLNYQSEPLKIKRKPFIALSPSP